MSTPAITPNQDFQYIKLPDGSYGKFRADATDDFIKSSITKDFPDAYKSQNQTPPEQPGFLKRTAQSMGLPTSMAELQGMGETMQEQNNPISHPSNLILGPGAPILRSYASNLGSRIKDMARESVDAGQNIGNGQPVIPNLGKAAYSGMKAVNAAVPFVGENANNLGDDVASGNYKGAAGDVVGTGLAVAGPEAMRGVGRAIKAGGRSLFVEGNPQQLMTRAIRPPVTNPELESAMVDRMGQVVQKSEQLGKPLTDKKMALSNYKESVDAAKGDSGKAYGDLIDQTRGTPINVRPVGRAIMQSTPATDRLINPSAIQKNAVIANQFDRNMPIEDADAVRVDTNAKLKDFWNQSGGDKSAARSKPDVARTEAINTGTRNAVYGELKGRTGINPEPIQNAYGQLEEISDAAARRGVVYGRQVPVSMGESMGAATSGPKGFITGKILKGYNDPNLLIGEAVNRWGAANGMPRRPILSGGPGTILRYSLLSPEEEERQRRQ